MNPEQVVKHFGSQSKAARAVKLSRQAIWNWLKRRQVPELYQYRLEELTAGKLKRARK
jgi:molybdenum-dependent DNA-binding transcriptional regulator ModE